MTDRRVLVVTHYWPPHIGGIESVAVEHARSLAARGWAVTVATSRLARDASHEEYGPVSVARFRCSNTLERALNVPVPMMSPTMLAFLVRESQRSDVVVAHGHVYLGSLYAALATRRAHRPLVVIQHSPFVDYGSVVNVLETAADRFIGRFVLRSATRIVAVSGFTAAYVRTLVPEATIDIVRSGIDTKRFRPAPSSRRPLRPRVVTVRRLVPRNGVGDLVSAWRDSALGDRAELLIGGNGPEMARIQAMSAGDPSIRLLGYVPDEELPALYRDADLFVLPSRSGEGFGLVALEAMASGLPVVATASGGVVDIVQEGINGRLVPPHDGPALAQTLDQLVGDVEVRAQLSRGALDTAGSSSWQDSIDRLEESLFKAMSA